MCVFNIRFEFKLIGLLREGQRGGSIDIVEPKKVFYLLSFEMLVEREHKCHDII